jgi:hypothetical protein
MKSKFEAIGKERSEHPAHHWNCRRPASLGSDIESIRAKIPNDLEILDVVGPGDARSKRYFTHSQPIARCFYTFTPIAFTVGTLKLARTDGSDLKRLRKADMKECHGK